MKKITKLMMISLVSISLLQGCSMNKDDTKGDVNKTDETSPVKDAEKKADDSIDNMVKYFNDKKVEVQNMEPIKNMEFAAHEGRSFMVDGKSAYLYRVKSDDDNMKKVIKEANDKGKVKVNINNKEMEYGAKVNGEYLLLYDTSANMNSVLQSFGSYVPGTQSNSDTKKGNSETNNSGSTSNQNGTDSTTKTNPLPENED